MCEVLGSMSSPLLSVHLLSPLQCYIFQIQIPSEVKTALQLQPWIIVLADQT